MRLALFGGTFDPVHYAHLILAERVREQLNLDRVLFIPSANSPHKLGRRVAADRHRLAMLRLALRSNPAFAVAKLEIERGGTSFTVDTVNRLQQELQIPRSSLFLIVGADNLVDFHTWKEPDRILQMVQLVVIDRPHVAIDSANLYTTDYLQIDAPLLQISSTWIRELVAAGRSIRYLVPESVEKYIYRHRLYINDGE
ncbi:MAG TPA: nicotinate-nucleotide adenylyltransferase [bacterium]|nr:nicotinate-nucleotide adenylyltransferase [bacterium]HOX86989.1 nicotinate-nucleotide adenylyltransferase [bacterium]HPG46320.1 nicotinate-nucleotide adenylyltransferase [bacterium]HPM98486.1 nicotinate-nucleotide adenylyltransferase [bacterium]